MTCSTSALKWYRRGSKAASGHRHKAALLKTEAADVLLRNGFCESPTALHCSSIMHRDQDKSNTVCTPPAPSWWHTLTLKQLGFYFWPVSRQKHRPLPQKKTLTAEVGTNCFASMGKKSISSPTPAPPLSSALTPTLMNVQLPHVHVLLLSFCASNFMFSFAINNNNKPPTCTWTLLVALCRCSVVFACAGRITESRWWVLLCHNRWLIIEKRTKDQP